MILFTVLLRLASFWWFCQYTCLQVLDFGCAEAKLVKSLISQETLTHLEEVVGVDIDGKLLEENKFRIQPLISDYLRPRTHPFKVSLYQGKHYLI